MLRQGSNCEIIDVEGKNPLHWGASSGGGGAKNPSSDPVKTVQVLLEAGPKVANWQDYEGRTPLHLAVADSFVDVVEVLLKHDKIQINALDANFRSALHWAAVLGKSIICMLLLENGARFHCQDANGATPLHYAIQAGMTDTVETLMRKPEVFDHPDLCGRTALMWAAALPNLPQAAEMIRSLCRHGSDHGHQDLDGWNALHVAVANCHLSAIDTLITLGDMSLFFSI